MKTIFEEMGGTYRQVGDYFIPSITLPDDGEYQIGKYGRMRRSYLKEYRKILYNNYVLEGTLFKHLAEIDQIGNERIENIVSAMAKQEGVIRHAIIFKLPLCSGGILQSCRASARSSRACSDNSVSSVSVSLSARTTWFFRFFSGRSSADSSSSSQRDFHLLRHRLCNRNRPFPYSSS